eukprot:scaffold477_cov355-Pinguiococcus_pyrenoidosus.AAC.4
MRVLSAALLFYAVVPAAGWSSLRLFPRSLRHRIALVDHSPARPERAPRDAVPLRVATSKGAADDAESVADSDDEDTSVARILKFAIPALAIFLANPIMSFVDTAFVGSASKAQLASLNPATLLTGTAIFLFSFLPRATTGLVARALLNDKSQARQEMRVALSGAFYAGLLSTGVLVFGGQTLLGLMNVPRELYVPAMTYVLTVGIVTPAALLCGVAQSGILATQASGAAAKSVVIASIVNLLGDLAFCQWPLQKGIAGAALATALSTLLACFLQMRALAARNLWPEGSIFRIPSVKEAMPLLRFAGPLSIIVLTRIIGFVFMSAAAAKLGTTALAAHQVLISLFILFACFAEPLSQVGQTMLPKLFDKGAKGDVNASKKAKALFRTILRVGASFAGVLSIATAAAVYFGGAIVTSDAGVISAMREACPIVVAALAGLVMAISVDGAMIASQDFAWIIRNNFAACGVQIAAVILTQQWGWGLFGIWTAMLSRFVLYTGWSLHRLWTPRGGLGKMSKACKAPPSSLSPAVA